MIWTCLVYFVVVLHFAFILFVAIGGLLLLRYPSLAGIHLPAVAWGFLVQVMSWPCPLTPLEIWLRQKAGMMAYQEDFFAHYLLAMLYPEGITYSMQLVLGVGALLVNLLIYWYVFFSK